MSEVALSQTLAALSARFPGAVVSMGRDETNPRFHLYHALTSICAQKVRATFAATGQSYVSHRMELLNGDSYDPAYVRVRLHGCASAGLKLVDDHTGATSVSANGCDACVVPTVVDQLTDEIIVDSHHICRELDRRNPNNPGALMPDDLRGAIEAELAIIDEMPNYQLLAATFIKSSSEAPNNEFAASKVRRCETLIAAHRHDLLLTSAYASKRRKEQAAAEKLFDKRALAQARTQTIAAFEGLGSRLRKSAGIYLFGSRVTLADLFWASSWRAEDLALSEIWDRASRGRLAEYYCSLSDIPALRHAVLDCPGARFGHR